MKKGPIFFSAAIRGNRQESEDIIINIGKWLQSEGFIILNEQVINKNPIEFFAKKIGIPFDKLTSKDIERQDIAWLDKAEYVIAEISGASTGTGREIEYARVKEHFGHTPAKILCLYNKKNEFHASPMIRGMTKDKYSNVTIVSYNNIEEAKNAIRDFLNF
jgi:2'-deoxynucleoside 5'-phosphate N-hydrolase